MSVVPAKSLLFASRISSVFAYSASKSQNGPIFNLKFANINLLAFVKCKGGADKRRLFGSWAFIRSLMVRYLTEVEVIGVLNSTMKFALIITETCLKSSHPTSVALKHLTASSLRSKQTNTLQSNGEEVKPADR